MFLYAYLLFLFHLHFFCSWKLLTLVFRFHYIEKLLFTFIFHIFLFTFYWWFLLHFFLKLLPLFNIFKIFVLTSFSGLHISIRSWNHFIYFIWLFLLFHNWVGSFRWILVFRITFFTLLFLYCGGWCRWSQFLRLLFLLFLFIIFLMIDAYIKFPGPFNNF